MFWNMYRRGECTGKRIIFAQGEGGGRGVGAALHFWPRGIVSDCLPPYSLHASAAYFDKTLNVKLPEIYTLIVYICFGKVAWLAEYICANIWNAVTIFIKFGTILFTLRYKGTFVISVHSNKFLFQYIFDRAFFNGYGFLSLSLMVLILDVCPRSLHQIFVVTREINLPILTQE